MFLNLRDWFAMFAQIKIYLFRKNFSELRSIYLSLLNVLSGENLTLVLILPRGKKPFSTKINLSFFFCLSLFVSFYVSLSSCLCLCEPVSLLFCTFLIFFSLAIFFSLCCLFFFRYHYVKIFLSAPLIILVYSLFSLILTLFFLHFYLWNTGLVSYGTHVLKHTLARPHSTPP